MKFPNNSSIPAELGSTGSRVIRSDLTWLSPSSRVVDAVGYYPLTLASTIQANGQTIARASINDSGIAGRCYRETDRFKFAVTSTDAQTAGALRSQLNITDRNLEYGREYTASVSLNIGNWVTAPEGVLFFELKDNPDSNETGRQPVLAMYIIGGNFVWTTRYDSNKASVGTPPLSYSYSYPIITGRYVTVSASFFLTRGSGGKISPWIDGVKLDTKYVPIGYNDDQGVYSSIGLYCYDGLGAQPSRTADFKGYMISRGGRDTPVDHHSYFESM